MKWALLCFVVSFGVRGKGDRACLFKNQDFAVGTTFKDPDNSCLTYTCTKEGFTTKVEECPEQAWCSKELRKYDANGCCYTCQNECQLVPLQMAITKNTCKGVIRMYGCKGRCKQMVSYSDKERKIRTLCSCCKPTKYAPQKDRLFCSGGRLKPYSYMQVTACSCEPCNNT